MPSYRRNHKGRVFFFTVVTNARRTIFENGAARTALGKIMRRTAQERPFVTEAGVLLPNHLHVMWRMPHEDTDYSTRLAIIKKQFTEWFLANGGIEGPVGPGQRRHRNRGVWQSRFWEHTIRDARDWRMHVDYIHANPVKHGLVCRPWEWPWSTFRRYVSHGAYERDWCGRVDLPDSVEYLYVE